MQFRSEFEWIAPSGVGLLTHYMPAHYAAGWWMDSSTSLAEAEQATFELFRQLKSVALTRNVLLPVGTDYTPPNAWVTDIHRDWNARYTWPRFVCAVPSDFFAAVRAELDECHASPSPQTRDMNPIYTGKDVSYIDTKQANRAAEDALLGAERFATFAALLSGARYPEAALAKAWVQLAWGAHHDAITGSESDQVYLDLLTGWRDAWELGRTARANALTVLSNAVCAELPSVVVWNPLGHKRSDIVTIRLDEPVGSGVTVLDSSGAQLSALIEDNGHSVSWRADDVGSLGWRTYRVADGAATSGWAEVDGLEIGNEFHRLRVDPERGGGVVSLVETGSGRELIAAGAVGNELAVYEEYPAHPQAGEGPWHLLPKGPLECSSATLASVQAYRSPLGERLVVRGGVGTQLRYTQTLTLWHGIDRVDCRTTIDDFTGADRLVRLRWPCPVPGALPVSEVGDAVVGRGFGLMHDHHSGEDRAVDSAQHPWTLDNPAHGWFGLSSCVRVIPRDERSEEPSKAPRDERSEEPSKAPRDERSEEPTKAPRDGTRAVSVAEVVVPAEGDVAGARDLMVALVRAGVTATCSSAERPRYGDLDVDSNLPDTRIALGGPERNPFTAAVLAAADPCYAAELKRQLAQGHARILVPAVKPLGEVWVPDADLRGVLDLPVLIVAGEGAVTALVSDLADAQITVVQDSPVGQGEFEAHTVALINRGVPGFAVEHDGTLHASLMRSCTGWPSGTWIDPPKRTAPDGSNFQLQHWSHTFDFALVTGPGDWRVIGMPSRSAEFNHPLLAVPVESGAAGLSADGSLLSVDGGGAVQLAALKPRGNPTATGSAVAVDPADVTLRLVETAGSQAQSVIATSVGTVGQIAGADLLERARPVDDPLKLHGYQIATVTAHLDVTPVIGAEGRPLAPDAEAAQPLYARYWLHNRGPAPLGGLPAVAHLHPQTVRAAPGETVRLRLTTASDCSDADLAAAVRMRYPPGWQEDSAVRTVAARSHVLRPRGHRESSITIGVPDDAQPGHYPVRAELTVTDVKTDAVPPAWRQRVEDICVVTVGEPDEELMRLVAEPAEIVVDRGCSGRLTATVASGARADLALEAHLISPWGTWEWTGPAACGATLPARSSVEVGFDVAPPPWAMPGQWWALIRIACAGRLLYTPAVAVTVR
jgi:alpha-mannosidase